MGDPVVPFQAASTRKAPAPGTGKVVSIEELAGHYVELRLLQMEVIDQLADVLQLQDSNPGSASTTGTEAAAAVPAAAAPAAAGGAVVSLQDRIKALHAQSEQIAAELMQ
ncbi:MAG: hypothetical protein WDW38_011004 [Sanguina aurantia]